MWIFPNLFWIFQFLSSNYSEGFSFICNSISLVAFSTLFILTFSVLVIVYHMEFLFGIVYLKMCTIMLSIWVCLSLVWGSFILWSWWICLHLWLQFDDDLSFHISHNSWIFLLCVFKNIVIFLFLYCISSALSSRPHSLSSPRSILLVSLSNPDYFKWLTEFFKSIFISVCVLLDISFYWFEISFSLCFLTFILLVLYISTTVSPCFSLPSLSLQPPLHQINSSSVNLKINNNNNNSNNKQSGF